MDSDGWLLIAVTCAYLLGSFGRYILTRRRMTTLGDTLLSNVLNPKSKPKTVS